MTDKSYEEKKAKALARLEQIVKKTDEAGLRKMQIKLQDKYDKALTGFKPDKHELEQRDEWLGKYVAYLIEARHAYEGRNTNKQKENLGFALATCEKLSKAQGDLENHKADKKLAKAQSFERAKQVAKKTAKYLILAGVLTAGAIGVGKGAKAGFRAISNADIDREAAKQQKVTQVANAGGTIINNNQTSVNVHKTTQGINQNVGGNGSGGSAKANLSTPSQPSSRDGGVDGGTMTYTQRLNQNINSSMDQVTVPKSRSTFAAEYRARAERNAISDLDVHGSDNAAHIAWNMVRVSDADRAIANNNLQKDVDVWRAATDTVDCVEDISDDVADIADDVADTIEGFSRAFDALQNFGRR